MMEHAHLMHNLSESETGEAGMLRSRIDQQSELICILKRRADEYLEKCLAHERDIKDMHEKLEESTACMERERTSALTMTERFNQLDENHNELIKIKNDLKNENEG